MWLMLRLLKDSEEHFYAQDNRAPEKLGSGVRATVGTPGFVAYCSKCFLLLGMIPFWAMKWFRPKDIKEYSKIPGDLGKTRSLLSLIDSAKKDGYVEPPKKGSKQDNGIDRIRISPNGDDFITYFGGIEALLRKHPSVYSIVGLSLLPWIISNRNWLKEITALYSPWW